MSDILIESLNYWYPECENPILEDINLEIEAGEFVLIVGGSGSGKSTLLRAIKGLIPSFHGGRLTGQVTIEGCPLQAMTAYERATIMGFVFQNPEDQVVMSRVEDEIVFGMENVGLDALTIKRRLMEVADALGISNLLERPVESLSGGQLQKVALASVLAMQPDILLLDEPTSQLDPFSGEDTLTLAKRLNEDNGMTVILVEQRLERCMHLADRIVYMEHGRIVMQTTDVHEALRFMAAKDRACIHPIGHAFSLAQTGKVPLTVKDARQALKDMGLKKDWHQPLEKRGPEAASPLNKVVPLMTMEAVRYAYPDGAEVLQGMSYSVNPGSFTAVLGENGAGKSTLLKLMAGVSKFDRGKMTLGSRPYHQLKLEHIAKEVGYLSQNPNDYLLSETVKEEIEFTLKHHGRLFDAEVEDMLEALGLKDKMLRHPRDLSTGERQRVALGSILALQPKILLLDEPTRGLDYLRKAALGKYLKALKEQGMAIFMVTHDIEFAAEFAEQVVLMSRGEMVAEGDKREILSDSIFYSSQISKVFKDYAVGTVTVGDAVTWLSAQQKEF